MLYFRTIHRLPADGCRRHSRHALVVFLTSARRRVAEGFAQPRRKLAPPGEPYMSPGISTTKLAFRTSLIAPCGMNCRLCIAFSREKNPCPGCRGDDSIKTKTRVMCPIKTCEKRMRRGAKYCFGCDNFPCARLDHLDRRYRAQYGMSMTDNLERIRKLGVRQFMRDEKDRWTCPGCGGILCVHISHCPCCGYTWRTGASLQRRRHSASGIP